MEIAKERYGRSSAIVFSQLPVETWYEVIGDEKGRPNGFLISAGPVNAAVAPRPNSLGE